MNYRILVVDDEENTRIGLERALKQLGYTVILAGNGKEALPILKKQKIDLLLTDLKMPQMDGMTLMSETKKVSPDTTILIITAYGTVESAVNAMKSGAYDYISKPINLDEIEITIQRALTSKKLEKENKSLRQQLEAKYSIESMSGTSPQIQHIKTLVQRVSPSKSTVLIEGESGTGKELIANAIHYHSPRKNGSFVAIHCAALSENILESELFGHEKGSFTGAHEQKIGRFERADGGTLFLDEVSEISTRIQVKLLRVLQEKEFERVGGTELLNVDVRVISATNANLDTLVKEGKFREDLFYRLNVVNITVPPLRERTEDIPPLIDEFLHLFNVENAKHIKGFYPDALLMLRSYSWPGNIRELRNCIESMVVLSRSTLLDVQDIPYHIRNQQELRPPIPASSNGSTIKETEKQLIHDALNKTGNNKTSAAKLLGISRRTMHRKLKEYGI